MKLSSLLLYTKVALSCLLAQQLQAQSNVISSTAFGRGLLTNTSSSIMPYIGIDSFSIIVLPDTQIYTLSAGAGAIFTNQMTWITNNASALNIKMVLGLGDIIDGYTDTTQWQMASNCYRILDNAGIPNLVIPGNHDYDDSTFATITLTNFNTYFPRSRYSSKPWFGGTLVSTDTQNMYFLTNFAGIDFIFLGLEFGPRDATLSWANGILNTYSNRVAIITTHDYHFGDNTRHSTGEYGSADTYNATMNSGDGIWQKALRQNKNVSSVFAGHVYLNASGAFVDGVSDVGRSVAIGDAGNIVTQMLSDYQGRTSGGNGYLRIVRITPSKNLVSIQTYSPTTGLYLTNKEEQFSFPLIDAAPAGQTASQRFELESTSTDKVKPTLKLTERNSGILSNSWIFSRFSTTNTDNPSGLWIGYNLADVETSATRLFSIDTSGYFLTPLQIKTSSVPRLSLWSYSAANDYTSYGEISMWGSTLPPEVQPSAAIRMYRVGGSAIGALGLFVRQADTTTRSLLFAHSNGGISFGADNTNTVAGVYNFAGTVRANSGYYSNTVFSGNQTESNSTYAVHTLITGSTSNDGSAYADYLAYISTIDPGSAPNNGIGGIRVTRNGSNIGSTALLVNNSAGLYPALWARNTGLVGIATTNPATTLDINGGLTLRSNLVQSLSSNVFTTTDATNFVVDFNGMQNRSIWLTNEGYFTHATNFNSISNYYQTRLILYASGADRAVYFPTNWNAFNTNGFEISGVAWKRTITNGYKTMVIIGGQGDGVQSQTNVNWESIHQVK